MCSEYNGWTNWETWVTKLWIDNDEPTYIHALELVKDEDLSRYDGAQALKTLVYDFFDPNGISESAGLMTDFIHSSMNTVDWYAIYDAYKEDGY